MGIAMIESNLVGLTKPEIKYVRDHALGEGGADMWDM